MTKWYINFVLYASTDRYDISLISLKFYLFFIALLPKEAKKSVETQNAMKIFMTKSDGKDFDKALTDSERFAIIVLIK